jgi:putative ABC transport system permease protein
MWLNLLKFLLMIKTTLRFFARHLTTTLILITGMIIGLTSFLVVYLYVNLEFSFDKFHKQYKNIYRVEQDFGGTGRLLAQTHRPAGAALAAEYPVVKDYTRFCMAFTLQKVITPTGTEFTEPEGWWADPGFFRVFTFPLLKGDPYTALLDPMSVVLTEKLARKLFPDGEAMGQTLIMGDTNAFRVTGIARDCPPNTHIQFSFLASLSSWDQLYGREYLTNWQAFDLYNYVVLAPGTDAKAFEASIKDLLQKKIGNWYPSFLLLKPLKDIHFHSQVLLETGPSGNLDKTWIFLAIGLFVLALGGINYVNLSTARAALRAREIGIRKMAGSSRWQLIQQFLVETSVLLLFSMLIALSLVQLLLPTLNKMLLRSLRLDMLLHPWLLIGLLVFLALIILLSGAYPAFYLSSLAPAAVIRSHRSGRPDRGRLRKMLVTFQFIISALLISGTLILVKQVKYLQSKDLGYNRENILTLSFRPRSLEEYSRYMALKEEISKLPGAERISLSQFVPNGTYGTVPAWFEGAAQGETANINKNSVDEKFFDTYHIQLILGDNFHDRSVVDTLPYVIINEAAARRFGWETILGKRVEFGQVIGMVKDFHYYYPGQEIQPLVMYPVALLAERPVNRLFTLSIRALPGSIKDLYLQIEKTHKEFFPGKDVNLQYFEDEFQNFFYNDVQQTRLILFFSGLALLIACLGLFGLSAFMVQQRSREMAVRKVLGANASLVLWKYLQDFLLWVGVANVFAIPVSFYVMNLWLKKSAFHTYIPPWIYVVTVVITMLITLLTVLFHSLQIMRKNPATVLSYE